MARIKISRVFDHKNITSFDDIPMMIYSKQSPYQIDVSLDGLDTWVIGDEPSTKERPRMIEMCPDYQRGRVWTEEQRVHFVEYVLRGGRENLTIIYNQMGRLHNRQHPYECVDGLQRMTALHDFRNDKLVVFGNKTCSDLTKASKHGFPWNRYHVRIHIMSLQSRADILRFYLEMNGAGTPHSKEELERVMKMLRSENRKTSK